MYLPILNNIKNRNQEDMQQPSAANKKKRFSYGFEEIQLQNYPESEYNGPKLGKQVTTKFANELLDSYKSGQMVGSTTPKIYYMADSTSYRLCTENLGRYVELVP